MHSSFSLLWQILKYRWPFRFLIVLLSFFSACLGLAGPFFQKEFVDLLSGSPLIWDIQSNPLFLLLFSFLCILGSLAFTQLAQLLGVYESLEVQRWLGRKLYQHSLDLRSDSLSGHPTGEVVATYATDVPGATVILDQSLPTGTNIIFPLILSPIVLHHYFGISYLPILSIFIVLSIVNFFMAYRQSHFFYRFKTIAAERMGLVGQWVQNIRTLRILGWVSEFEKKILKVREFETLNRLSMLTNGQTMNSISSSITFIINIVAVISFLSVTNNKMSSGTLLALLWIIGIFLTKPFRQMPWFFTFLFDSWTSLRRVNLFLRLKNIEHVQRAQEIHKIDLLDQAPPDLIIQNLNLEIGGEKILKNINLQIKSREFVAIVGEVGSGKTSLLLSLTGENGATFDQYHLGRNDARTMHLDHLRQFFSFVPQSGFIMSANLRENITLEYDKQTPTPELELKIKKSLRLAEFDIDSERVTDGLETEIGERGVNLSGGQKQRVSLARVDFYKSPVILLDDCLSAVDVDTENKLIDGLILSEWANRTRILTTHRLTILDKTDRVLFLKDGKVLAFDTYKNLLSKNKEFQEYTSSVSMTVAKTAFKEPEAEIATLVVAATSAITSTTLIPSTGEDHGPE